MLRTTVPLLLIAALSLPAGQVGHAIMAMPDPHATTAPAPKVAPAGLPAPIVFIHGIKGATLEDASGKTVWMTGWQAMGFSSPPLSLPIQWDDQGQARDSIRATGILKRVDVIPWVLGEEAYGTWIKKATELGGPFVPFSYDWRRDPMETLARFTTFVEETSRLNGGVRVRIVAHSLGGLIAMALLKQRPELVERAVFAGVPFGGGVGFLVDLHGGIPNGLNARILSPEVLFTFPSVYALFPETGKGLVDAQGAPIPIDFYNAEDWARLKLGAIAEPGAGPAEMNHLKRALAQAKKLRTILSQPSAKSLPPVLVVLSSQTPTRDRVTREGTKSVKGWDFDSADKKPGDGRITAEAAEPAGVPHETYETRARHSLLLNDSGVIERIRAFLK